ncbi:phage tail protein I [Leisingera sp. D0M16]|uniref:phage tail protein I n=1 Tax=Leisingera coralii TaxID=3351347 RepID=UPI003B824B32
MSESLLPHNATPQERSIEAVTGPAMLPQEQFRALWDPHRCPAELLPWLAYAFSVDVWDPNWPEENRRAAVREAFALHREKGTKAGLVRALAALGVEVGLEEWFEYAGRPYTFRATVQPTVDLIGDPSRPWLSLELRAQVRRVLESVKPARAHVDLAFLLDFPAQLKSGSSARSRSYSSARLSIGRIDRISRLATVDSAAPRARHFTYARLEVQ